jgi:hypothetical protein
MSRKAASPKYIVDSVPTIIEDMKVLLTGHALSDELGIRDSFRSGHLEGAEGSCFLDSYITLFNHVGPNADAPVFLINDGESIDKYKLEHFYGTAKYLSFSNKPYDSS